MPQILAAAHSYSARPRIPASSRLTSSRSALHSSSAGHRMNARAGRSRSTEPCASSLRCASCTCLGRNGPSSPHSSITSLPAPGRQRRRLRLGGGGVWWWWCVCGGQGAARPRVRTRLHQLAHQRLRDGLHHDGDLVAAGLLFAASVLDQLRGASWRSSDDDGPGEGRWWWGAPFSAWPARKRTAGTSRSGEAASE